jgi:hypothetical protein
MDGDQLTAELVLLPEHGDVTLNPNGSFTYTPDTDFGGQDQFTYRARDGQVFSNVATVRIDVFFDWQNPTHSVDVNGDGFASPLDSLIVRNDVARNGVRTLPSPPVPPQVPPPFLDVNGDRVVSDFDAARVLQDLNTNGSRQLPGALVLPQTPQDLGSNPLVRFRLATTDEDGQAASTFGLGDTLLLNVYARDLRTAGGGIFSAYLDVTYNQAGLAVGGPIVFGSTFADVRAGTTATPGLLDEVGAVQAFPPGGNPEVLLFQIPLVATALGQFPLQANRADLLPPGDVTLFGIDGPIPAANIEYGLQAMVTIVQADTDGDGVRNREEGDAPNNGDGNSDGTADALQGHVASVLSPSADRHVTLVASSQTPLRNVAATANPSPGNAPPDVQFPLGFFQFDVSNVAAGAATTVTVRLEPGAVANTVYRYGPTPGNATPHWYPFLFDGETGAVIHGDRLELRFVEGKRGDDSALTSGVTVGFAAFGFTTTPWRNPVRPEDVNNDGVAAPSDALQLINEINRAGARSLPLVPTGTSFLPPLLDPNGDNQLSPADVLHVVNYLNSLAAGEGEGEDAETRRHGDGESGGSGFGVQGAESREPRVESQIRSAQVSGPAAIADRRSPAPVLSWSPGQTADGRPAAREGGALLASVLTAGPLSTRATRVANLTTDAALATFAGRFDFDEALHDIAEDIAGCWLDAE